MTISNRIKCLLSFRFRYIDTVIALIYPYTLRILIRSSIINASISLCNRQRFALRSSNRRNGALLVCPTKKSNESNAQLSHLQYAPNFNAATVQSVHQSSITHLSTRPLPPATTFPPLQTSTLVMQRKPTMYVFCVFKL